MWGFPLGHGAEGGAEWIRGRVGVRGLGRRVDCIDRIDLMDWMDGMASGVGATRRVDLRCGAAGPSGEETADRMRDGRVMSTQCRTPGGELTDGSCERCPLRPAEQLRGDHRSSVAIRMSALERPEITAQRVIKALAPNAKCIARPGCYGRTCLGTRALAGSFLATMYP